MALIKRSDAETFAREAVVLHLGDLEQEGESLIAAAKTRAESILAKGRAERDRLVAGAAERGYKGGFTKGYTEGLAKGEETGEARALEGTSAVISALMEQWGVALTGFEARREAMISETRRDIVRLAAALAEKVARRAVELDESAIERTLEDVVRRVVGPTTLVVAVHPDDVERASRLMPALLERVGGSSHATVVGDASVARGGCCVRTRGGGVIDADVEASIARMVDTLLPRADAEIPAGSQPDSQPDFQTDEQAASMTDAPADEGDADDTDGEETPA